MISLVGNYLISYLELDNKLLTEHEKLDFIKIMQKLIDLQNSDVDE